MTKHSTVTSRNRTLDQTLNDAGITDESVREFIHSWAALTTPERVEVINAEDDERLITEALAAGELLPAGQKRYYCRSHPADTARCEERTVVATADPADAGVYNNWRDSAEVIATQRKNMAGAARGKTLYVVPYLMAVPGSRLARYAVGVQLSDDRLVVLNMIRMARVGVKYLSEIREAGFFVRGVHITGDLTTMDQGGPGDRRLFATVADERMILHFGSAYGGNALLGKIAHGLRQGCYDGWAGKEFMAEQFMLLAVVNEKTGDRFTVCGGFPSASGKTNLAMTLPPAGLADYRVEFYGDDITWLWVDEQGRLRGMNPENGVFGVARDTNENTNPAAMAAIAEGSGTIFTNVARHDESHELWWEGKTPQPPADVRGWRDWQGKLISERSPEEAHLPWAHPNARFTTALSNVPTVAADAEDPAGVVIDAVIFGGRTRDREPLIRALRSVPEGVYDGLCLGAEATFAADGLDGVLRYDPMSMRPFLAIPEARYAQHWLDTLGRCAQTPIFAHVNWFARNAAGEFAWPGYRENLRALLWLAELAAGRCAGRQSPIGVLPDPAELDLGPLQLSAADEQLLFGVDERRWREEINHRQHHLEQFTGLPQPLWETHRELAARLGDERA